MNRHHYFLGALLLIAAGSTCANAAAPVEADFTIREIEALPGLPDAAGANHWLELTVESGENVKAGQRLAVQKNAAGEVVQEYTAGADGEVVITARPSPSAPGDTILEIHTGAQGHL